MAMAAHPAAGTPALFEALLTGDSARVHRLLQSSTEGQLSHTGPCGFTTLHAGVVGGCADALPALVHVDQALRQRAQCA